MREHTYSVDVEGTPDEVWSLFWSQRSGRRSHGEVTIEILHPGDGDGEGLVRHCVFPVPRWLLSRGRGVSWEWLTEVDRPRSWRYDAVGRPLWSKASGFTRLEDLGERTRIHFRETYHAFNPVMRALFERRVHRAISRSNDETLASSINAGLSMLRARKQDKSPRLTLDDRGAPGVAAGEGQAYVVVTADAHAAPDDLEHFLSYVEPAQRDAVAAFGDLSSAAMSMFGGHDPGDIEDADPVRQTAARRLAGMGVDVESSRDWLSSYGEDWVIAGDGDGRRLAVLEEQGIHAEVTFPGPVLAGGISPAMYLGTQASEGLDVVWPALHAYNRWLADFCNAAPGRRAGVIPLDLHDMDRAVQEIEWGRDAGLFGGVLLPAMSVRSKLPGYADERYERLWSACEDHGMVVNLHTGASGMATDGKYLYDAKHGGMLGLYEVFVFTRRPLWFMVFGGVFDRHPRLRVAVTENGVQWLPSLVRDMEQFFDTHGAAPVRSYLEMRPAEYFERHVYLGGSLMQRGDAEMRHEIGVDRLMWGADFPHLEGAAPYHRQVLAHVFGGLPEADLRRILGGNAADLWGFDGDALQAVADRVGPAPADLAEQFPLEQIPQSFSWSLARQVPLATSPRDLRASTP